MDENTYLFKDVVWKAEDVPAGGVQGLLNIGRRLLGRPIVTERIYICALPPIRLAPGEQATFLFPAPDRDALVSMP